MLQRATKENFLEKNISQKPHKTPKLQILPQTLIGTTPKISHKQRDQRSSQIPPWGAPKELPNSFKDPKVTQVPARGHSKELKSLTEEERVFPNLYPNSPS